MVRVTAAVKQSTRIPGSENGFAVMFLPLKRYFGGSIKPLVMDGPPASELGLFGFSVTLSVIFKPAYRNPA